MEQEEGKKNECIFLLKGGLRYKSRKWIECVYWDETGRGSRKKRKLRVFLFFFFKKKVVGLKIYL